MTDFIIASVCQSQIFAVDTSPLYAIADEISKVGTNINQIAKVANTTGHIYENEIKELQTKMEKIENVVYQHLNLFQKVRGRIKNGIRKN
jgi:acetyl-CoA carboxylase alpha subunit